MADNLKGIVVEIGGDVTPLQKALEGVNRTSRDLQGELRAIEQGLKLDPTNTVLLAQKQELLGQSVENTRSKLETLRAADQQMREQGTNDPMSESYRALQRELVKTEQQLARSSSSLAGMSQGLEASGDSAQQAQGKMGGLSGVVNGLADTFGIKLPPQITGAISSFDAAGQAGGGLGDKVSALAQSCGVELPPQLAKGISSLGGLTAGAVAAAAAVVVVVKALVDMAKAGAKSADDIAANAVIMGVANETYQEFLYMADLVDTSAETIGASMSKLTRSMNDARQGSEKTEKAFSKLGVTYKDSAGNLRDNEEVFYDVIDALGQMTNETERDAVAMEILGKSARDLNPLIEAGSERMRDLAKEAHDVGAVMTGETLEAYLELADEMDRSKTIGEGLKNTLGSIVAPGLTEIMATLNELVGNISKSLQGSQLVETLKSVFSTIGTIASTLGSVIWPVLKVIFEVLERIFAVVNMILAPLEWLIKSIGNFIKLLTGGLGWTEFVAESEKANQKLVSSWTKSADTIIGKNKEVAKSASDTGAAVGDSIANGFEKGARQATEEVMTYREAQEELKRLRKEAREDARKHYTVMVDEFGRYYIEDLRKKNDQVTEAENYGISVGQKTTEGISKGLRSGIPGVEASTNAVVNTIKTAMERGLKIQSPSREGFGWGAYTIEGFIRGVDSKLGQLRTTMGGALDAVGVLGQPNPRQGAGGGTTLNVNMQVAARNLHEVQDLYDLATRAQQEARAGLYAGG